MTNKCIWIIMGLVLIVALSPVLADEPTLINGSWYHNHSYMEGSYFTSYITPDPATSIVYPPEYTIEGETASNLVSDVRGQINSSTFSTDWWTPRVLVAVYYELNRHTILLEKQNELLAEQNRVAWIQAGYVPHTASGGYCWESSYNTSALKYECSMAGYPPTL